MIAQMAREERWEFPGQEHAPIDCADKQIISLQNFQPDSVSTETMTHQGGNPTFSHSTISYKNGVWSCRRLHRLYHL